VAGLRKAGGTVETNYTARELPESYAGSAGTQGIDLFCASSEGNCSKQLSRYE
jgi:hypothetical protein